MIKRFSRAIVAALICSSFFFGAGCQAVKDGAKRESEQNSRNLCKEHGKRLKKEKVNVLNGKMRQICRDGTVYERTDNGWAKK